MDKTISKYRASKKRQEARVAAHKRGGEVKTEPMEPAKPKPDPPWWFTVEPIAQFPPVAELFRQVHLYKHRGLWYICGWRYQIRMDDGMGWPCWFSKARIWRACAVDQKKPSFKSRAEAEAAWALHVLEQEASR